PEPTRSISVTFDKIQLQLAKSSLKKDKMPNDHNLEDYGQKKKELLIILQQVRDLNNATNSDTVEETI
ncbi:17025_t:CDS:2, partial [Gigaspora margarita]